MTRLLPLWILASVLVLHDASPAAHAHVQVDPPAESTAAAGHASHDMGDSHHEDDGPGEILPDTCGTERLGFTWNGWADLEGKPGAVSSLPMQSAMAAFEAISPSLIDHPPGHPPDKLRALYSVYRI